MSEQGHEQKAADLDGYFEAWARTLIEQVYDHVIPNFGKDGTDDKALTDLIKQELSDVWHHRAGDGALSEVVTFIAEHDPMRQLDTLPFLDKSNPIGDLIRRFEAQRQALEERDRIIHREYKRFECHADGINAELKQAGIIAEHEFSVDIVEDVQRMRKELAECREMVGALLGIKYTREGARSVFETWKDQRNKPMAQRSISQDVPTRPDAPQSIRRGMTLGQVAYEAFTGAPTQNEDWASYARMPVSDKEPWEFAGQAIAGLFTQAYPMLAFDIGVRFAPPFPMPIEPLKAVALFDGTSIEDGHIRMTYKSLYLLLEREQHLSRQITELQLANSALVEERRAYDLTNQVRELFTIVLPNQERLERPGIPSNATMRFRVRLVAEEFVEMLQAVYAISHRTKSPVYGPKFGEFVDYLDYVIDHLPMKIDLPEFIDALGDLKVVTEGAFVACGVDSRPIQLAIHHANMAKKDGPLRESDGKRLKPPGWKPADIKNELHKQGWLGNG